MTINVKSIRSTILAAWFVGSIVAGNYTLTLISILVWLFILSNVIYDRWFLDLIRWWGFKMWLRRRVRHMLWRFAPKEYYVWANGYAPIVVLKRVKQGNGFVEGLSGGYHAGKLIVGNINVGRTYKLHEVPNALLEIHRREIETREKYINKYWDELLQEREALAEIKQQFDDIKLLVEQRNNTKTAHELYLEQTMHQLSNVLYYINQTGAYSVNWLEVKGSLQNMLDEYSRASGKEIK